MRNVNKKQTQELKLGTKLKDKVSGWEGIAIAKIEFLNGCIQFSLKPKLDKDGKMLDAQTFDSEQLEIVDKGIYEKSKKKAKEPTGGIMPDTPIIK